MAAYYYQKCLDLPCAFIHQKVIITCASLLVYLYTLNSKINLKNT